MNRGAVANTTSISISNDDGHDMEAASVSALIIFTTDVLQVISSHLTSHSLFALVCVCKLSAVHDALLYKQSTYKVVCNEHSLFMSLQRDESTRRIEWLFQIFTNNTNIGHPILLDNARTDARILGRMLWKNGYRDANSLVRRMFEYSHDVLRISSLSWKYRVHVHNIVLEDAIERMSLMHSPKSIPFADVVGEFFHGTSTFYMDMTIPTCVYDEYNSGCTQLTLVVEMYGVSFCLPLSLCKLISSLSYSK